MLRSSLKLSVSSSDDILLDHRLQSNRSSLPSKKRLPPLHQHYDSGEPLSSLQSSPTIQEIGNGMYCIWEKKDDGSGSKVENTWEDPVNYIDQPLRHVWSTIQQFEIYVAGHVLHEYQYRLGQVIHVQSCAFHVYLYRLPSSILLDKELITVDKYDMTQNSRTSRHLSWRSYDLRQRMEKKRHRQRRTRELRYNSAKQGDPETSGKG